MLSSHRMARFLFLKKLVVFFVLFDFFKDPAMFQSIKDRKKDQKDKPKVLQVRKNDQKDKLKVFKPPKLKESSTNWGLMGFICCYFMGVGSIILGVYVSFLPHFGTDLFIGLYAFGNIFALSSTLFLVGPVKQLKRMCDMSRVLAALTMLACVVLTPYAALWWNSFGLTMLFCALHILSFSWYSLSFTPYVRKMLKMFSLVKLCRSVCFGRKVRDSLGRVSY